MNFILSSFFSCVLLAVSRNQVSQPVSRNQDTANLGRVRLGSIRNEE